MPWSWLQKPYSLAAVATATGIFLLPKSVTPILFRAQSGPPMTIHFSRVEPPKEAFDDIFVTPQEESKSSEKIPATNLNQSANENRQWNPLVDLNKHRVILATLEFSQQMVLAQAESEQQEAAWKTAFLAQLSPAQRTRLEAADEKDEVLSKDWSVPTWKEYAAQRIAQAEGQTSVGAMPSAPQKVFISQPNQVPYAKSATAAVAQPINTTTAMAKTRLSMATGATVSAVQVMSKPEMVALNGSVRLSPGLALGDRTLEIRRFVDGIPLESGTVNPKAGTFSIAAEALQGSLSIELFDKSGAIVASGVHRLKEDDRNSSPEIFVAAKNQFAGNFVNFDNSPSRLIADKVTSTKGQPAEVLYASLGVHDQTDALGSFALPKVSESSFGLVRAKAKGFAESLFLIGAGEGKNFPLIPSSLIAALQNLTKQSTPEDSEEFQNAGLVWGQVLFDGKPMSGINVSIEEDPEVKPVYMNGFIPLDTIPTTTANGYFVFPALTMGMHSLIATRNGEYVGHINVQVDEDAVSIGVIEGTTKIQPVEVKVYDAFDGSAQSANVQVQSLQEGVQVMGQADISLPAIQRMSLGYVQPDRSDYAPAQIVYSDSDEYIHIPLVRVSWLDAIANQRQIIFAPNTGTVIGFVPEDDFEPYLSHENQYDANNIVYFNLQGQVVERGEAGGGFVMFNVPVSTQSIVVLSKKTEMLSTQVVPVDANSSTLIKFRF
jgi:hypothetical protein